MSDSPVERITREHGIYVAPAIAAGQLASGHAKDHGRDVLRGLFLLNVGGIAAMPIVIQVFGIDAPAWRDDLLDAAAPFIGGLFCSLLGSVTAYFNFMWIGMSQAHRAMAEYRRALLRNSEGTPEWRSEIDGEATDHDRREARLSRLVNGSLYVGIGSAAASFAAFVYGLDVARDLLSKLPSACPLTP